MVRRGSDNFLERRRQNEKSREIDGCGSGDGGGHAVCKRTGAGGQFPLQLRTRRRRRIFVRQRRLLRQLWMPRWFLGLSGRLLSGILSRPVVSRPVLLSSASRALRLLDPWRLAS